MNSHRHFSIENKLDSLPHLGTPGTWFGIPDFGFTEAIFGNNAGNTVSNPLISNPTSTPNGSYSAPAPTQTGGGGGSWGGTGSTLGATTGGSIFSGDTPPSPTPTNNAPSGPDTSALFNQINSGWDSYTNQLNSMLNTDLPNQLASQQGYAKQSFDTSFNEATNQKQSNERQLGEQQSASLKDLGSNMKNLFQAGNTYLGNRGAGDSSAAGQYAYALTQMGSKARAGVMAQVQARQQQIGDIFNTEKNRLQTELTSRKSQLTDWFSNAQSQIRQQLGTAGLNKSKDIQALSQNLYNQAIQAKQQIESEARAQQNQLQTWAMNNSKSVSELAANLQKVTANNQPFQGIGSPLTAQQQSTTPSLFGGFGKTDEKQV